MYFINSFLVNFALLLFHMKKLITLYCIVYAAISAIAQTGGSDSSKANSLPRTVSERISGAVYTGTGVGFSGRSATSSFTYIAPVIGYKFSPKFKLNVGFLRYNINGTPFANASAPNRSSERRFSNSGNLLQVEGQYALNSKTLVSGGVLYSMAQSSKQTTYKGVMLGVDYKVAPHTTFSIRTTVIQGNGYRPSYEQTPFSANPLLPANPFPMNMSPFNF